MPSVYIKTLGCKVNSFDSDALAREFAEKGYNIAADSRTAEVSLINSCSVTEKATAEARYWLRRFRKDNPTSLKVITGCYAQIDSAKLAELGDVDFIVPNEAKRHLVDHLSDKLAGKNSGKLPPEVKPVAENRQTHFKSSATLFATPMSTKTRGFLKVQDGCNNFCTYCQIPYARGASVSVPVSVVLKSASELIESGVHELVLTGIHIGDYGLDLDDGTTLATLVDQLMDHDGLARLRISSLEPSEVTDELIEVLVRHRSRVGEHFHLPLQSGADEILQKMRRQYTTAEYLVVLDKLRGAFPNAQLSADVICGFPGETDELFQASLEFIGKSGLNQLHVFPYSKRPNTAALRLPGHLSEDVVKARGKELRALSERIFFDFSHRQIGSMQDILWEGTFDTDGRRQGKTSNYVECVGSETIAPKAGVISQQKIAGFVGPRKMLAI